MTTTGAMSTEHCTTRSSSEGPRSEVSARDVVHALSLMRMAACVAQRQEHALVNQHRIYAPEEQAAVDLHASAVHSPNRRIAQHRFFGDQQGLMCYLLNDAKAWIALSDRTCTTATSAQTCSVCCRVDEATSCHLVNL